MKKLLCNTEFKQKVSEFSLPYNGSALKNLRKALRKSDSPLNIELSCISVQNGRQRKGEGWDASWKRKYKDWPREKLSFFYFLSCGNCVPHLETLHTGKLLPGPPFSSRTSVSALGYVTFGRQKSRQLLPEFLKNRYKLILNRWFHTGWPSKISPP